MSSTSQAEILQKNTKLLRKSLLMPEQTKFEALKRILEDFVKNGVSLFNKWCQPYEPVPPLQAPETSNQQPPRSHLRYSFQHFAESVPQETHEDVEVKDGMANQSNQLMESANEDLQNSKAAIEEQSFEARFKKGAKRIKQDESESSFEREPKKKIPTLTKEESRFFEAANFAVFLEMQKNILQAKKRCKDRSEEEANSKCAEYLKYALKVGSLATQSQAHSGSNLDSSRNSHARKQGKNLRKKVLFEDDSHQLYDLSKVYESLDAQKLRRQQHRQLIAETKRREEEQRKAMIERADLQRRLEAQKQEQEAIRQQKQRQEQERKQAEEKQNEEERKQQIQANKQLSLGNMDGRQQNEAVEEQIKPSNDVQQLPQAITEPQKKPSDEKKSEVLLGTPVKEGQQQSQTTPLKINNPFFNPPAKTLKMQDLINNHKPATADNPIFPNIALASPPRSNIFSAPNPINNPFTGGPITSPTIMTPTTLPIPILKQPPQPPPTVFSPFPTMNNNPNSMSNNPSNAFVPPALPSFFPPANSPGFQGLPNQGFNSSSSSSGGILAGPPLFPSFPMSTTPGPSSKNLFMDQPIAEENSIFGGGRSLSGGSTNVKPGGGKGKKAQIRIS